MQGIPFRLYEIHLLYFTFGIAEIASHLIYIPFSVILYGAD